MEDQHFVKALGSMSNNIPISELQLMRDIFDDYDMKSRITENAFVIEQTLESFGIFTKIKEVNILPSKLQFVAHALDNHIARIPTHQKDLCISLAVFPEDLSIEYIAPQNKCSIYIKRVNDLGYKIREVKRTQQCNKPNPLAQKISNYLFHLSYNFFRTAERKCDLYFKSGEGKIRDFGSTTPYLNKFKKMKDKDLITEFNQMVNNNNIKDINLINFAFQSTFEERRIDYSEIVSFRGLSFSNTIAIKDNKILIN